MYDYYIYDNVENRFFSAFIFLVESLRKQFTTLGLLLDGIVKNKVSENLTNYFIWKLHTRSVYIIQYSLILAGIYIYIFFNVILFRETRPLRADGNKNKMRTKEEEEEKEEKEKSIEFYKASPHCIPDTIILS